MMSKVSIGVRRLVCLHVLLQCCPLIILNQGEILNLPARGVYVTLKWSETQYCTFMLFL